jgi:hypothetical protein
VLDSTPLYDAVATMDTITLIRSAVRGLLTAADADLAAALRAGAEQRGRLRRQRQAADRLGRPGAREELIDSRARTGSRCSRCWMAANSPTAVEQAASLLATVLGQDLETGPMGCSGSRGGWPKDRVISTVDPDTRHGHKTSARGFDGYKGHAAVDPDSEIITAPRVTPGNAGDASVAEDLVADLLDRRPLDDELSKTTCDVHGRAEAGPKPQLSRAAAHRRSPPSAATAPRRVPPRTRSGRSSPATTAYWHRAFHDRLEQAGIADRCKTQTPTAAGWLFSRPVRHRPRLAGAVSCPGGSPRRSARPAPAAPPPTSPRPCPDCPLRAAVHHRRRLAHGDPWAPTSQTLTDARARQTDPAWVADYRATRPKVERKLGHLVRRHHGGRRARVRGTARVDADFRLLAGAVNLARLAVLGLRGTTQGWAVAA